MALPFEKHLLTSAEQEHVLQTKSRHLPHWTMQGATYFITFCLSSGSFSEFESMLLKDCLKEGDPRFYTLFAAMIMPDHIHLLVQPHDGISLSRMMKGIKGVSARKLNEARKTEGSIWQAEWYDRIVRNDQEYENILTYMLNNPIKAGLVDDGWNYIGWYFKGV